MNSLAAPVGGPDRSHAHARARHADRFGPPGFCLDVSVPRFHFNSTTAGDEVILSIPGIGNRMLHEFKEYRPYRNMEQFRREIGKYVDKKEVARFERYVTVD